MNSGKIVMLPLDERPCNFDYPAMMPKTDCELILPPKSIMGDKKIPGNVELISDWLLSNAKDADALILSLDTLVYGGIVPSRLHKSDAAQLIKRVDIIKALRELNPEMKLYVFGLIMRCPRHSSDAEEPDYYKECGAEIHLYGKYTHLEKLGKLSAEEEKDFERVKKAVEKSYLDDYLTRRKTNLSVLMHALSYAADGTVDYFIVPQDDSAVYGFTAMDQMTVRDFLKSNILHKRTAMYPSADDTGLTLLARAAAQLSGTRPKVYVHYSSSKGGLTIPIVEDRILAETIKYHILSVDGIQVYSLPEADILLGVNVGSAMLSKRDHASITAYDIERNLAEFVNYIQYALSLDKTVAIADVAMVNTADTELTSLLHKENMMFEIHAYAGWNTSSNTIGTALCQAILYRIGSDKAGNDSFLAHRYYEDIGYMAYARRHITNDLLPTLNLDREQVDGKDGVVADLVRDAVVSYMEKNYPDVFRLVEEVTVTIPWVRMFETDIKLKMSTSGEKHCKS